VSPARRQGKQLDSWNWLFVPNLYSIRVRAGSPVPYTRIEPLSTIFQVCGTRGQSSCGEAKVRGKQRYADFFPAPRRILSIQQSLRLHDRTGTIHSPSSESGFIDRDDKATRESRHHDLRSEHGSMRALNATSLLTERRPLTESARVLAKFVGGRGWTRGFGLGAKATLDE
jgi:hypothetical protein